MPLYEYECQACGHHLEEQQKMADAALVTCPKCGKDELQRLISATSFHLKGGGWYKDLYSSTKPGEKADAKVDTKSAAPSSGEKSASSSESAPSAPASTSTASEKPAAAPAATTTPKAST